MVIRPATQEDFNGLCKFNIEHYPDKSNIDMSSYLSFWFSKKEEEITNSLVLVDNEGIIRGQNLFSSVSYFFNNEKIDSLWGFDLFVDEQLRSDAWGVDIILYYWRQHRDSLSTGVNEPSLALNKKLRNVIIGEIKKYIGIVSPLGIFTCFFRKTVPINKYPDRVELKTESFERVSTRSFISSINPYNDNLLEPERDSCFLEWRFNNNLHKYAFYKSTVSNNYFVLRTVHKKQVILMELVDFRCRLDSTDEFDNIFNAAKKITQMLHLPILFCGSSHSTIDYVLEKGGLRSVGRNRPIIGGKKFMPYKEQIEKRNFVFITLADSDGETAM